MAITGPWYITRAALEDYGRLTGTATPSREALEREIATAHFVRQQESGAELWRGGKPLRLRFIVALDPGVGGDAPQLVRVEGDHAGRNPPRARKVRVWDGERQVQLEVTAEVHSPGPERRIAYHLTDGQWFEGYRGRARPDHVERWQIVRNTPAWVRLVRGQPPRAGGRGQR